MVFSSLIFLFAYLPLALLCYFIVPKSWRNTVLFLISLVFYAWGEPIYIFLMLISIASAYGFGILIEKYRIVSPKRAKRITVLSVTVNLLFLFFFKYYNFVASNLSVLPFVQIPIIAGLALPIGISFYTFQIISYTIDLYRGDCKAQTNFISFGTYVTLFPQLIAGPIVRYRDIDGELASRNESVVLFSAGIQRFCVGLAKKVLVGDLLAAGYEYYKTALTFSTTVFGAWMTVLLFSLHLYYDFSGYSDMAIGLGKMFGFHFPENFNYPYISKSITEFWRRWHISLSTWFREYVYIPLGGNRHGTLKRYRNLAIVWFLTGFWHGANWNFLLWGIYFCVILIMERAFLLRLLEKLPRFVQHLYAIFLILVGFLIFSFSDLRVGFSCLWALFGWRCVSFSNAVLTYQFWRCLPLILIAAIGATPIPKLLWEREVAQKKRERVLVPLLCVAVLILCVAYLVDSTFSPFAYTQF